MINTFDFENLYPAIPELIILFGAIVCLIIDFSSKKSVFNITSQITALALFLSLGSLLIYNDYNFYQNGFFELTRFNFPIKFLVIFLSLMVYLIGNYYLTKRRIHYGEFNFLYLVATLSFLLLISATKLVMIYLAMETAAIAGYILCGLDRSSESSGKGALIYFFLNAFASAFFILGSAFLFGATGSLDLTDILNVEISDKNSGLFLVGMILSLSALLFKVGLAPFHWWLGKVYDSVPSPVAAFLSTVAKLSYFWLLYRYIIGRNSIEFSEIYLFLIISVILSLVLGCVIPLRLKSVKRIFAFGSINQMGYVLLMSVLLYDSSMSDIYFYLCAYLFAVVGSMAIIVLLEGSTSKVTTELSDIRGLFYTNRPLAISMTIFLLSFAGIPLTAGFIGKLRVFNSAFFSGSFALGLLVIATSLISFGYYYRILISMFDGSEDTQKIKLNGNYLFPSLAGIYAMSILTILFGIFPDIIFFLGSILE